MLRALALLAVTTCAVATPPVPVVHVVLVWLAEPGNDEHRARIVQATRDFADLPGVLEIRVGPALTSTRPNVDASFDLGLYMVFESRAALDAYQRHPRHTDAVARVMRPLAARTLVYDFEDSDARR